MKPKLMKLLLFLGIYILAGMHVFGQSTSEDEVKILTLGIKNADEIGISDFPKHSLQDYDVVTIDNVHLRVRLLCRKSDNTVAGFSIKATSATPYSDVKTIYFAYPARNGERESYGWTSFFKSLDSAPSSIRQAVVQWISVKLAEELH
jgi:hypothetical protein